MYCAVHIPCHVLAIIVCNTHINIDNYEIKSTCEIVEKDSILTLTGSIFWWNRDERNPVRAYGVQPMMNEEQIIHVT